MPSVPDPENNNNPTQPAWNYLYDDYSRLYAIQDAKGKGCEEFELGRSDCNNVGLISFKERWGAARTELRSWTYPQRPAPNPSRRQMAILGRLVPLTPTFALQIVGKLFYGHAG